MQCSCGGATKIVSKERVRNKRPIAVAELKVCEACGRNAGPVTIWRTDSNGNKIKRISDETLEKITKRHSRKSNTRKRRN